ncbi:hypothetical protein ACG7TL_005849 [Trametes sanguinea]
MISEPFDPGRWIYEAPSTRPRGRASSAAMNSLQPDSSSARPISPRRGGTLRPGHARRRNIISSLCGVVAAIVVYICVQPLLRPLSHSSTPYEPDPLLKEYIDRAILRSHRDLVGRPDYALHAYGARVLPELTSRARDRQPSTTPVRSPEVALSDSLRIGDCWEIEGDHGQLGLRLSDIIYPFYLSIDHIPAEIAMNIGAAPRHMILWGAVDGPTNERRLRLVPPNATLVDAIVMEPSAPPYQPMIPDGAGHQSSSGPLAPPAEKAPSRKRPLGGRFAHEMENAKSMRQSRDQHAPALEVTPLYEMELKDMLETSYSARMSQRVSRPMPKFGPRNDGGSPALVASSHPEADPAPRAAKCIPSTRPSVLSAPALHALPPLPASDHQNPGHSQAAPSRTLPSPSLPHAQQHTSSRTSPATCAPLTGSTIGYPTPSPSQTAPSKLPPAEIPRATPSSHPLPLPPQPNHAQWNTSQAHSMAHAPSTNANTGYPTRGNVQPVPLYALQAGDSQAAPSSHPLPLPPQPSHAHRTTSEVSYMVHGPSADVTMGYLPAEHSQAASSNAPPTGGSRAAPSSYSIPLPSLPGHAQWNSSHASSTIQGPYADVTMGYSTVEHSHAAPSFVPTAGSSQTTLPSQAFPPPQHQDPQWNVLQVSSTTVHRPPSDVMIRNSAPARVPPTMIAAVKERIARSYGVDAAVRMDDEELATIWVQMSDDGRRNTLESYSRSQAHRLIEQQEASFAAVPTHAPSSPKDAQPMTVESSAAIVASPPPLPPLAMDVDVHNNTDEDIQKLPFENDDYDIEARPDSSPTQRKGKQQAKTRGTEATASANAHARHNRPLVEERPMQAETLAFGADMMMLLLKRLDAQEEAMRGQMELQQQIIDELKSLRTDVAPRTDTRQAPETATSSDDTAHAKSLSPRAERKQRKVVRKVARLQGKWADGGEDADEEENDMGEGDDSEDDHLRRLKARVRHTLETMLGISDWSEAVSLYPPLTEDEITRYLARDPEIVCTATNFRIDFKQPWKKFAFNKEARAVFIDRFFARISGGAFSSKPTPQHLLTHEIIGEILDKHMNYCRQRWRRSEKPPTSADLEKRAKRASQRSRQQTLLESRHVACRRRGLTRHTWMFSVLEAAHMSADETDGPEKKHPPMFQIVAARWQSQQLKDFLWKLDIMYREDWAKPRHRRAMAGNAPRVRILPQQGEGTSEVGIVPFGLPRNFYDGAWLATLPPYAREELDIIDEEYDFSI